MALVGIVMGSDSDMPVMAKAADILDKLGVSYEMTIISAHREPDVFFEYAKTAEEKGLEYLYNKALEIDKEAMKNISPNDQKRILRVLEIYKETGKTKTQLEIESRKNGIPYDYKVFALNMPREILYDRINRRVDIMIEKGLIEEVKKLYEKYGEKLTTSMQGIGYKEVVEYLNGNCTKEEMIEKIKMETRRYAKRQLTWFRKIENIEWLDALQPAQNNVNIILEGIK